jgi:hypothetical protein
MEIVNIALSDPRSITQINRRAGQTNSPQPSDSVEQAAATSPRNKNIELPPCISQWRRIKKMEREAIKKASGNWTWKGKIRFSICDAENIIEKTSTEYASLELKLLFSIRQKAKHSSSASPA